ncbi:MAG: alcohol dehydrogenase catalytic domain-containing protein [Gemmatimonadetes bacterium]|nr:alcohol dehydrogenase catalytic domain-containing protein [Gemmatimonadota bacterium]
MKALEFRHEVVRYLATRAVYQVAPRWWTPRLAPLHFAPRERPEPKRPGWLRVGVRLAGVCGSDVNLILGRDSLYLEPEASYPFVPGHEFVGVIEKESLEVSGDRRLLRGTRVAVWPVLGCRVRDRQVLCRQCAEGWDGLCEDRERGWPGVGLSLGFNRETGGGWAEACLAHASQLWPLPDEVSDEDAVLLDPAATALAAVLRTGTAHERTLVIGGGTIGLLSALLHKGLELSGSCEVVVRYRYQERWARNHALTATTVAGESDWRAWAKERSFRRKNVLGYGDVYHGTFDRVIVAAGSRSAFKWALRAVRPRGTIALVAAPTNLRGVDPTVVWYREIAIRGVYDYGPVPWEGEQVHPYSVMLPRLADGTLAFRDLVTHVFTLDEYRAAMSRAVRRGRSESIKVVFRLSAA